MLHVFQILILITFTCRVFLLFLSFYQNRNIPFIKTEMTLRYFFFFFPIYMLFCKKDITEGNLEIRYYIYDSMILYVKYLWILLYLFYRYQSASLKLSFLGYYCYMSFCTYNNSNWLFIIRSITQKRFPSNILLCIVRFGEAFMKL